MSRFIRLRGLPWSATNQEICDFLAGCNVVNGSHGIYLVMNKWDGKHTGEAFVELEGLEDEQVAYEHNKKTMGHRYIEIFGATREEAENAMKKPVGNSNVLKLRGLPFAITEEQIEDFFQGLAIKPDREGILIVVDRRGRASGEAYVQFESQEDTENALKRNREKIGHRYIEIFRSSIAEMRRQSGSRPGPYDKNDRSSRSKSDFNGRSPRNIGSRGKTSFVGFDWGSGYGRGADFGSRSIDFGRSNDFGGRGDYGGRGDFGNSDYSSKDDYDGARYNGNNSRDGYINNKSNTSFADFNEFMNSKRHNFAGSSFSDNLFGNSDFDSKINFGSSSVINTEGLYVVHMRGLPYSCYEKEVKTFFHPSHPVNIKIIYNKTGLHSGTADAFFETEKEADEAMKKQRHQMGNRYIELFYDGRSSKNNGFNRRI